MKKLTAWVFLGLLLNACATQVLAPPFVDVKAVDKTIVVEARYFGHHNFLGRSVAGYRASKCLLTKPAAEALAKVQADLVAIGYSLKVYDCYRPQKAVDDFVAWSEDVADQKMKAEFYPRVDKKDAFKLGYIAARSGHSRGSTLDLTVIKLPAVASAAWKDGDKLLDCAAPRSKRFADNSIDMGTGYDCFDDKAATASPGLSKEVKSNRQLLKQAMEKHGFENYEKEWWHYTLKSEPYPDTFHDFDVQ
jgi:zinc D-Ala-D-Ala dipeptidase